AGAGSGPAGLDGGEAAPWPGGAHDRGDAERARARGAPARVGDGEHGRDRDRDVHLGQHGEDPPQEHLPQAGGDPSRRGGPPGEKAGRGVTGGGRGGGGRPGQAWPGPDRCAGRRSAAPLPMAPKTSGAASVTRVTPTAGSRATSTPMISSKVTPWSRAAATW